MASLFERARRRPTRDEQDDDVLQRDADRVGCPPLVSQAERSVCSIHGELQSVTLRPVDGVTALEATLHDGTDTVTLVWLGRRRIEGVVVGRHLTVHGRIGRRRNERILYNPRYELHA